MFLQIGSFFADYYLVQVNYRDLIRAIHICNVIAMFRALRLFIVIQEIKSYNVIFSVLGNFSKPFWNMALSLYTVYYLFSQLGQICFGGRITEKNADMSGMFYLMNFNDQGSSIITLFHLSIVNNWYVTCNMFCAALHSSWPRLYFILWWATSVLVLQNLIIAFVMEIYGQTT